jgi:hypothetical protein
MLVKEEREKKLTRPQDKSDKCLEPVVVIIGYRVKEVRRIVVSRGMSEP